MAISEKEYMKMLTDMQDSNNKLAQYNADKANQFTWKSQKEAQRFNAEEAQKNRNFQLLQRSNAHQVEVQDLIRAGLNPVLSANNGASVTSGATASIGSSSGTKSDIDMQRASLLSQFLMNKANNALQLKIAKLNNANALKMANISAAASMYGANASAAAARFGAMQSAAASMFGSQLGYDASVYSSNNALTNSREQRQWDQMHPSNKYQLGASIFNGVIDAFKDGVNNVKKGDEKYNKGKGSSSAS